MSTPDQEARALRLAWEFLLDLSSGAEKRIPSATRQRARRVLNHYPLAADYRWFELTGTEIPSGYGDEWGDNDIEDEE
jgi:hypothetical protein